MGMTDTVSVIGIDVRVPGSDDLAGLLDTLGRAVVRRGAFGVRRLRDALLTTEPEDHHLGSYLDRIDAFDETRFRIAGRVAEVMDPHQRLCLESSADAIEDAIANGAERTRRIGVYASASAAQLGAYERLQRAAGGSPDVLAVLAPSLAARVSHVLDLSGPAVVVDTACSSGLVAVAQARRDLLAGAVDLAVVTSANLLVVPGERGTEVIDVVSATDRTLAFDRAADGASVGEGVLSVVLGRTGVVGRGYGVVSSIEVGQDGRTPTMAAPSPTAQTELVDRAWSAVDGALPLAVVAHATGTAVGDAIEFESLSRVSAFSECRPGSVGIVTPKSSLGHLDAASGLLGLVVALGVATTGVVPPAASFVAPRDDAQFVESPFYVPAGTERRRPGAVGVSAFGLTGTIAHAVVTPGVLQPRSRRAPRQVAARRWFRSARNTFADGTAIDLGSSWVYVVDVAPQLAWEMVEHVVDGRPMLVGSSLVELVHRALSGSPFDSGTTQLTDVVILEPVAAVSTVTLSVELHRSGAGVVRFRSDDMGSRTWATFRIHETPVAPSTAVTVPESGLIGLGLDTVSGDDTAAVSVSERWQVGIRLAWDPEFRSGVLRARPNASDAANARTYDFYPAVLDAALNALNATFEPTSLLFPWSTGALWFDRSGLSDGEVVASIREIDRVRTARGDVVLTVDVDVRDASGRLLLAARDHRVKNTVEGAVGSPRGDQRILGGGRWHDIVPVEVPSLGGAVGGRRSIVVEAPATSEPLADACSRLADHLLQLNRSAPVDVVVVRAEGAFGIAAPLDPSAAALAATAYSMRTEVVFDVAVVDSTAAALAAIETDTIPVGLVGVDPSGRAHAIRSVPVPEPSQAPALTGTLLVLGASNGIGHAWAEHVAGSGRRRVVRAARSSTAPGSTPYRRADVVSAADLAAIHREFPDIDQVVSFAGVPASGLHVHTDRAAFDVVLAAKTTGARNVLSEFGAHADVVLVGSVAAYSGALGQAEYAAANAYQHALARSEGARSVLLGGWSETGMAAGRGDDVFERVTTSLGLAELDRFTASELAAAAVYGLEAGGTAAGAVFDDRPEPTPVRRSVPTRASAPSIVGGGGDPRAQLEDTLRRAWAEVLGDIAFEADRSFFDYGGDSVSIVRLGEVLEAHLPGVFDVTSLFSSPTIADQIEHAQTRIGLTTNHDVVDVTMIQELLRQGGA